MESKYEISEEGIDPIDYVKDYFSHLTIKEISVLVGSIALLQEVDLSVLQSVLNLDQIEVEEKIGRLMQTDLLDGRFTATHFILDKFNYKIIKQNPNLTLDDRTFIAYLKARHEISIKELQEAFDLSYPSTIFLLSGFIAKGLVSSHQTVDEKYEFVVHFSYPSKEAEDITTLEKEVVGFFQLMGQTSIKQVAEALEEPEHKILSILTNLILSEMVIANFETNIRLFGGFNLSIKIDKFQVYFPRLSLQVLPNNERNFIGYLSLRRDVRIDEFSQVLNLSNTELIKLASLIQSTNQFTFEFVNERFRVNELRPVTINRSLDVLTKIHVFNYRILVGLIQTQKRISVKEISNKMELPQDEIIQALITCYLEGFIEGHLDNRGIFTLRAIQKHEKSKDITLERWEKIILGALISEDVITWPKIAALLEIDRFTARNRALEFISKGISNTIAKDTLLTLEKIPNLPPLVQISDLNRFEKQVFGFIHTELELSIKSVSNKFNLSNIQVFRLLYYLTGSGLVTLKRNNDRFDIVNIFTFEPERSISELEITFQQIIRSIELQNEVDVDLRKISKEVEIKQNEVELIIFELVASGYYKGKIEGRIFTKTSSLIDATDAGICLFCTKQLPNSVNQCPHCSQKIPLCGVCRGQLNSHDQLLACPKCKNLSHSNHIRQWLQVKNECPFCRAKITINQLLVQHPLL